MKVCHLISGDLWAGPEVQLYTLLCSLKYDPGLDISVILLNEGKLAKRLREAGIDTSVIGESNHNFLNIRKQLVEILRGEGIDIIHSHRYKENVLAALVKKRCDIRYLVQTVHGVQEHFSGFKKMKIGLYSALSDYLSSKYFDRIIPVSEEIRDALQDYFGSEPLVTIHNAVNTDDLKVTRPASEVRKRLQLINNQPIIGTAGRMVPIKGFDLLLKAATLILQQNPMVRFLLAGDGPQRTELENLAHGMGLDGKVQFIGFRDDITDIINCLDLFVMSSHHEGIPMILLEAMALQKPIVCTAVGGIKEVVQDGVSGLLVPPGDASALADTCLTILEDDQTRMTLGAAAKRRIKEEFSVDVQKTRIMNLYRSLAVHS